MDVQDFVGGEVKARVEGERELVVEGRTETKTGDWSASSSSFRRRFCLPANTDLAAVSAVLSDDGILTVTAPLKVHIKELLAGTYVWLPAVAFSCERTCFHIFGVYILRNSYLT